MKISFLKEDVYKRQAEDSFVGIIDLVEMKAEIYKDELGKEFDITEIPADMADVAQEWREKLVESVAAVSYTHLDVYKRQ